MPAAIANKVRRRRRLSSGWISGTKTVASRAAGSTGFVFTAVAAAEPLFITAVPASAGALTCSVATATGDAAGTVGGMTTVLSGADDGDCSAVLNAATNDSHDSHRAFGSLARPRRITASARGPTLSLRVLGAGGALCTCAYRTSSTPSS